MKSSRKVLFVLLIVTALGAAVVSPAAAAPPASRASEAKAPAVACEGGTCQIVGQASGLLGALQLGANLALTQLPFESTADGSTQATLGAKKDITLSLPIGELTLTNASLQVEVGQDGRIKRLNGSAAMPFPTFGLLNDVRVVTPARANVGLELGKNLPDSGFDLVPDRPYLFFNANSFMNVAGRTSGTIDEFSLSFAPGQRLTLAIDTIEPIAYLNGQVTLSLTDQIALLGGLLEHTTIGPYVPDTLPLRERTYYGLSGKFSKDVAASSLTLRGSYMLDAGFLPAQLGIDAQLVNVLGQLTLSRDGVLVDGVLKSAIEPDKVFDGSVQVVTFIPLRAEAGSGYAGVDTSVKIPAAKLGVVAGAKAGAGKYELSGQLSTPFNESGLGGRVAGALPDVAGTVGPALGHAAGSVESAAGKAAGTAGSAAGAVGSAAGEAAGVVRMTANEAGRAVGVTAGKAVAFVGPVARGAASAVSGYARYGLELAGNAINAGKARLSRDAEPAPALDM